MGLFYQFPSKLDPNDHCISVTTEKELSLHTYGPPGIFWGYLAASLSILFFMYLAAADSLKTMFNGPDILNRWIALSAYTIMVALPPILTAIFFYQKSILKKEKLVTVYHHLFGIRLITRHYHLRIPNAFNIEHLLDSPNMARLNNRTDMRGFQNNGLYQLFMETENGTKVFLDRHSQVRELERLKKLLEEY